jgi:hypothetical protein
VSRRQTDQATPAIDALAQDAPVHGNIAGVDAAHRGAEPDLPTPTGRLIACEGMR